MNLPGEIRILTTKSDNFSHAQILLLKYFQNVKVSDITKNICLQISSLILSVRKGQDKLSSRSFPYLFCFDCQQCCEGQQSLCACSWSTCNASCTSPVSALLPKKPRPLFANLPHLTQHSYRLFNEFIQLHLDKTLGESRPALRLSSVVSSTSCSLLCE